MLVSSPLSAVMRIGIEFRGFAGASHVYIVAFQLCVDAWGCDENSEKLRPEKLRPSGCLENSDLKNSDPLGVSKTQTQ